LLSRPATAIQNADDLLQNHWNGVAMVDTVLLDEPPTTTTEPEASIGVYRRMWGCDACKLSFGFVWYDGMAEPACKKHGPYTPISKKLLRRITPEQLREELQAVRTCEALADRAASKRRSR
jgi:hypothetical protein